MQFIAIYSTYNSIYIYHNNYKKAVVYRTTINIDLSLISQWGFVSHIQPFDFNVSTPSDTCFQVNAMVFHMDGFRDNHIIKSDWSATNYLNKTVQFLLLSSNFESCLHVI